MNNMYCQNCGHELNESDNFCPYCGEKTKSHRKYCQNCGTEIDASTKICPTCGYQIPPEVIKVTHTKSKLTAGLLGILLGGLGIHNFYLGYSSKGVIQLVLFLCGFFTCGLTSAAAEIWGIIEGIMILTGSIDRDVDGNFLGD